MRGFSASVQPAEANGLDFGDSASETVVTLTRGPRGYREEGDLSPRCLKKKTYLPVKAPPQLLSVLLIRLRVLELDTLS